MDVILNFVIIGFIGVIVILPAVTVYKNAKLTVCQKSNLIFVIFAAPVLGSIFYFLSSGSQKEFNKLP